MTLAEAAPWRAPISTGLPFDRWQERLSRICGGFRARPRAGRMQDVGSIVPREVAGLDVADLSMSIDSVERTRRFIADAPQDRHFLIFQAAGACDVEHGTGGTRLQVGDCVLVDAARPTRFGFLDEMCRHVSIHLPREVGAATARAPLRFGERIAADEPRAVMLRALISEAGRHPARSVGVRDHRALLLDAVRLAFREEAEVARVPAGRANPLETALAFVERHLCDERLTPAWLAERLGVSLRTLQRTFESAGLRVAIHIRDERLRLARRRLQERARFARRVSIAEIALDVGFNDVSYFNRSFREVFGTTPSDWVATVRSRMSFESKAGCASLQDS